MLWRRPVECQSFRHIFQPTIWKWGIVIMIIKPPKSPSVYRVLPCLLTIPSHRQTWQSWSWTPFYPAKIFHFPWGDFHLLATHNLIPSQSWRITSSHQQKHHRNSHYKTLATVKSGKLPTIVTHWWPIIVDSSWFINGTIVGIIRGTTEGSLTFSEKCSLSNLTNSNNHNHSRYYYLLLVSH